MFTDVNECTQSGTQRCDPAQRVSCVNTVGSYKCACTNPQFDEMAPGFDDRCIGGLTWFISYS